MIALENDTLRIEVEPHLGGKIVSFFHKQKNFQLAAQGKTPQVEFFTPGESFAPYAFGMDDAFPNINEEKINWNGRNLEYPDHGEIWSAEFKVRDMSGGVWLEWVSGRFGYRYQKNLRLDGNALQLRYCIANESEEDIPCFWTWHGLVRYEEDMLVLWPSGTRSFLNVQTTDILGTAGIQYDIENGTYDFAKVPKAKSESTAKYYVDHPVHEGRCGLYYPSKDVTFMMEYDNTILPYLGFWVTAGGFQGDYNCALEPTNGFYDSISMARRNRKLPQLSPGEHMMFELRLILS